MKVSDAMRERHSCRAFLGRDVEPGKIERILRLASRAPSGANTQPWQVVVVSGKTKLVIERAMEAQFRAGNRGKSDYQYYPLQWKEPYQSRRFACGMQLYSSLGIGREDTEQRIEQWVANYRSFGAPVALYFFVESRMEVGSFIDMGMLLQSVMLLAVEEGLATCPQQALAEYPEIVKQALGLGSGLVLLCGMALGYEDKSAAVNQYRTPRAEIEEFVVFHS
ncbi:MAG: nitroreductase [Chromatiaceae bacterium]|jgi:nitroreductase|nr:nitroreductase [Chromatiaceae bacterium]